eukprot:m51a1_g8520 hypothetical protein (236) ;mRNA; f:105985-109633
MECALRTGAIDVALTEQRNPAQALREVAQIPSGSAPFPGLLTRPWFWSPSCSSLTALALCKLLHCPDVPAKYASSREILWWNLWKHRDQWSSLLPLPGSPPEGTVHTHHTWLQDTSLCLSLGLHPRVGSVSPVQLLDPLFVREFVCSYLAPPGALIVLYERFTMLPRAPLLKVMLKNSQNHRQQQQENGKMEKQKGMRVEAAEAPHDCSCRDRPRATKAPRALESTERHRAPPDL